MQEKVATREITSIADYKAMLVEEFTEAQRLNLDGPVVDALRRDADGYRNGPIANFAFGLHAFATLVIPEINNSGWMTWAECLELSTRIDAITNVSADRNGADGLLRESPTVKWRCAVRVRRSSTQPEDFDSGLNIRIATRSRSRPGAPKRSSMSMDSEFLKLLKRVEERERTEYPAFQITAVVDDNGSALSKIRIASAAAIKRCVYGMLDNKAVRVLDDAISCERIDDKKLEAFEGLKAKGLILDIYDDAAFLWISDHAMNCHEGYRFSRNYPPSSCIERLGTI